MPLNLLKKYNEFLDLVALSVSKRVSSLKGIFKRDFIDNTPIIFKGKPVSPTPIDGEIKMDTLFAHLTTVIVDKATRHREYENDRSLRLHWVRFHIDCKKTDDVLHFSVQEPEGIRTYIYDIVEKYVVILEPLRSRNAYYLLTAYHLTGKDAARNKMMKKYKKKLPEVV